MFRKIVVVTGISVMCGLGGFAFAGQRDAQVLREAATALQSSNPSLSERLSKLAVHESREPEVNAVKEARDEREGASEEKEGGYDREYVKSLKEAAVALKTSQPALAEKLAALADENMDTDKNEGVEEAKEAGQK
jgi:hypothetical protein